MNAPTPEPGCSSGAGFTGSGLRPNRIPSSSTTNTSVAFGGTALPAPRAPNAIDGGHTSCAFPPTFMSCSPSVQHLMTPFSGNVIGALD